MKIDVLGWKRASGHNSKMGKLWVHLSLHADSIPARRLTIGLMSADADRTVVRPGNKRGRPSNLARQAAAAAAAAAAQLRDGDQASPSRSQNANPATDRDGLSQVIMLLLLRSHLVFWSGGERSSTDMEIEKHCFQSNLHFPHEIPILDFFH